MNHGTIGDLKLSVKDVSVMDSLHLPALMILIVFISATVPKPAFSGAKSVTSGIHC